MVIRLLGNNARAHNQGGVDDLFRMYKKDPWASFSSPLNSRTSQRKVWRLMVRCCATTMTTTGRFSLERDKAGLQQFRLEVWYKTIKQ